MLGEEKNAKPVTMREIKQCPWGCYEVITESSDHKIKRLIVDPACRTSLQSHKKRNEHWFVVAGRAAVLVEDKEYFLGPGGSVDIPAGAKHRLINSSAEKLVLIEVQTGTYFGEDDIERFVDDYGRV